MKIVLFNCKYSANLGDGLIAEALERAVREERLGAEVRTCDLAGRGSFGDETLKSRLTALRVLAALPSPLRRAAVAVALWPRVVRLRRGWQQALEGADLAIFGGGHLFQDTDLNFPLKIGAAMALCAEMGVPVAVHGVGVGRDWSRWGATLFKGIYNTKCLWVSVRDGASREAWSSHYRDGSLPDPEVSPDLALLTEAPPRRASRMVGLNVIHPTVLEYHAPARREGAASHEFYRKIAEGLLAAGHDVMLFTNGAAEDEEHLDGVIAALSGRPVCRAPRPRVPSDLVETQAGLMAMVGHRLHASILAFRLGVPSVGLGWDQKVASFYADMEMSDLFIPGDQATPEAVCVAVGRALDARVEPQRREGIIAAARSGVRTMLEHCVGDVQ